MKQPHVARRVRIGWDSDVVTPDSRFTPGEFFKEAGILIAVCLGLGVLAQLCLG